MARKIKDDQIPPYGSRLRNGNVRLQWPLPNPADPTKTKLVSITKILPNEPKGGYETPAEWWPAHERLKAAVAEDRDRSITVRGFAERWASPTESPWRVMRVGGGKRSESSLLTLGAQVRRFVELFPREAMAAIGERHVEAYLNTGPPPSSLPALATMFRDAATSKGGRLVLGVNPFEEIGRETADKERDRRDKLGILTPEDWQVRELLAAAWSPPYPIAMAAWLEMGIETGMRTGELDAMRFDHLLDIDGHPGYFVEFQLNARTGEYGEPKWGSDRKIILSPRAAELVEIMRPIATELRSPYVFITPTTGAPFSPNFRRYWWTDRRKDSTALRTFVPRLDALGQAHTMKDATRHFFTTEALREHNRASSANDGSPIVPIPLLAEHLGHKDHGETLRRYYAKTYDADMQHAMAGYFKRTRKGVVVELDRHRRGK